ncbi:4885_t:CDS:1 [Racocetra persica]|uniref:4885_t:CDS:1 n=1 Tax=Racocetra persica TaxID=160502 RepID=A0ACA9NL00_9GLOM|nr:4885_t:CDS:1 [Racocetra persica]
MPVDINLLINDLLTLHPTNVTLLLTPYNALDAVETKMETTYQSLVRSSRAGHHIGGLTYTYYLGELIEQLTPAQRTLQRAKMTKHYYAATIRVYNIFELFGVEQICRTSYMNLSKIATLLHHNYQQLIQIALTLKAMTSAEEESINEPMDENFAALTP